MQSLHSLSSELTHHTSILSSGTVGIVSTGAKMTRRKKGKTVTRDLVAVNDDYVIKTSKQFNISFHCKVEGWSPLPDLRWVKYAGRNKLNRTLLLIDNPKDGFLEVRETIQWAVNKSDPFGCYQCEARSGSYMYIRWSKLLCVRKAGKWPEKYTKQNVSFV